MTNSLKKSLSILLTLLLLLPTTSIFTTASNLSTNTTQTTTNPTARTATEITITTLEYNPDFSLNFTVENIPDHITVITAGVEKRHAADTSLVADSPLIVSELTVTNGTANGTFWIGALDDSYAYALVIVANSHKIEAFINDATVARSTRTDSIEHINAVLLELLQTIDNAKRVLAETYVRDNGSDVPTTKFWAPQAVHDPLVAKLAEAQATYDLYHDRNIDLSITPHTLVDIPMAFLGTSSNDNAIVLSYEPQYLEMAAISEAEGGTAYVLEHDSTFGLLVLEYSGSVTNALKYTLCFRGVQGSDTETRINIKYVEA
ncbi:MAG: hypothetical protein FWG87_10015 [Defluviitaleaceae bacterium]|nr:hypothetical protein [Defluviitaleaceae bacterium]